MQQMDNGHMRCSAPVNGWFIYAMRIRLSVARSIRCGAFVTASPGVPVSGEADILVHWELP